MATTDAEGARIIAVASGKGGTGKSLLAANIGLFLATLGKKVTLLDAAFGSSNLHSFLGVARPQRTLSEMMANTGVALDHVVVDTGIANLGLISGEGDPAWAGNPKSAQVNRLISRLRQVEGDYVVVDLGAGTSGATLDLFLIADIGIVVVVPEPTSVELAYRFLRAAFVRRLRKIGIGSATDIPPEELRMYEGGVPAPADLQARTAELDAEAGERIAAEMTRLRPRFVVNEVRSKADMELGASIAKAVRRRFGIPAGDLGHVEYDDAVSVAVRRRRPLLIEHPESRVARCIERVTRKVLAPEAAAQESGDSFYDLLEIEPAATEEEIRRANRRIREVYGRDSIVVGALYNKQRLDRMHQRIDEAYETLMDPTSRKAYDQALFPGGVPTPPRREDAAKHTPPDGTPVSTEDAPTDEIVKPKPPELAPDTEYTGRLMQEVREKMGVKLREISERTKIGMGYLRAIESENFAKLPAVVYVRGFLVQYARMLQLDEARLLETYLERYRHARVEIETEEQN